MSAQWKYDPATGMVSDLENHPIVFVSVGLPRNTGHLIAASPTMADALETVRQFVNDFGPEEPPAFAEKTNDTLAIIDTALSLARGEIPQ